MAIQLPPINSIFDAPPPPRTPPPPGIELSTGGNSSTFFGNTGGTPGGGTVQDRSNPLTSAFTSGRGNFGNQRLIDSLDAQLLRSNPTFFSDFGMQSNRLPLPGQADRFVNNLIGAGAPAGMPDFQQATLDLRRELGAATDANNAEKNRLDEQHMMLSDKLSRDLASGNWREAARSRNLQREIDNQSTMLQFHGQVLSLLGMFASHPMLFQTSVNQLPQLMGALGTPQQMSPEFVGAEGQGALGPIGAGGAGGQMGGGQVGQLPPMNQPSGGAPQLFVPQAGRGATQVNPDFLGALGGAGATAGPVNASAPVMPQFGPGSPFPNQTFNLVKDPVTGKDVRVPNGGGWFRGDKNGNPTGNSLDTFQPSDTPPAPPGWGFNGEGKLVNMTTGLVSGAPTTQWTQQNGEWTPPATQMQNFERTPWGAWRERAGQAGLPPLAGAPMSQTGGAAPTIAQFTSPTGGIDTAALQAWLASLAPIAGFLPAMPRRSVAAGR